MRRNRRILLLCIAAVLFLGGLFLVLRPYLLGPIHTKAQKEAVSNFYSAQKNRFGVTDANFPDETAASEITDPLYLAMKQYNEDLAENGQNITDPWVFSQEALNFAEYGVEDGIIGILKIPSIEQELPIRSGASRANLYEGVACFGETSLPIGGESTNCVIAGHRSWQGAKLFRDIDQIAIGDEITITNFWQELHYTVISTEVIQRNDLKRVQIQPGRDLLTLISCHPYGSSRYRYLVVCDRIIEAKKAVKNSL